MARRKVVKGYNPAALWLLILLAVLLLGGGAYFGLIVAPAQQYARQVEATATAQSAAIALAHSAATATAQALAALYARGEGLMNLGRWAEADAALQAVFDVEPNYRDVQSLLVTVGAHLAQTPPPTTSTPVPPTPTPVFTPTPTLTAMPSTPMPAPTFTPTPASPTPAPTPTATPAVTSTATPTSAPTSALPEVEITEIINVRSGPGTSYDVIGQGGPGARYRVIGRNLAGDWWEIDYRGSAGWVSAQIVTALNADSVAVSDASLLSDITSITIPAPNQTTAGTVREFGGIPFVYIPAGEFLMGSDRAKDILADSDEVPQRLVNLDAYWIMQTPVTLDYFLRFVDAKGYETRRFWSREGWDSRGEQNVSPNCWHNSNLGPDYPVACVTSYEAEAFANWLGETAGVTIELPTEAQWEKAARGADGRIYPWGDGEPSSELLSFAKSQGRYGLSHAVGSSPAGASPYGVLDMAGNVTEWTADWYDATYYSYASDKNPTGPDTGTKRAVRGGVLSDRGATRSADRNAYTNGLGDFFLGFRLVVALQNSVDYAMRASLRDGKIFVPSEGRA
jgi:formylglycine-generating enzyme required for sulfatase activity